MQKITITVDDETMAIVDRLAAKFSLDRSSTVRAIVRVIGPYVQGRGEHGIQTESRENTERA